MPESTTPIARTVERKACPVGDIITAHICWRGGMILELINVPTDWIAPPTCVPMVVANCWNAGDETRLARSAKPALAISNIGPVNAVHALLMMSLNVDSKPSKVLL